MSWQNHEGLNAKVVGKIEFAPGNFVLKVAPEGWELSDFTAGQYSVLGLPGNAPRSPYADKDEKEVDSEKLIKRAYSIASSSVAKDHLEFYISTVRSGALTPRLYNLQIGDKIFLGKKCVGMFTLKDVPDGTNVILMATGTGVAPYMSMMRTLVSTSGLSSKFAVIHGALHSWDLGYASELQTLERMSQNFLYLPVISKPEEEQIPWGGFTGYINQVWSSDAFEKKWGFRPQAENTHVFLCGNPLMVQAALKFLSDEGFTEHTRQQDGQIHLEKFW
ncbi:MAG: ferredoxin--NADP reductase [bacterium]|nr:ferredoxin--NADP reductase [bacterium]MBU1916641.1 ferredoxin--NADP reductase [bacterium]